MAFTEIAMNEDIQSAFSKKEPGKIHDTILNDSKNLVQMSRTKMREYYNQWDKNDEVYRALKTTADKEDIRARERKEPEKMVLPISYAQIQTFVAFCYSLYMQRDHFFELEGYTAEDDRSAKVGEALLDRDLSKNIFEAKLTQYLLDIARFGIGVMKCYWCVETNMVKETTYPDTSIQGVQVGGVDPVETESEQVTFEGNTICNISPYRFFPDTRLPLSRFQEGEFVASEEYYSHSQLKKWEKEGVVVGVDFINPISKEALNERNSSYNDGVEADFAPGATMRGDGQVKKTYIITEVQREIIPSEYEIEGKPLGEEDYPIKYVIWYANDNRVIKCEPAGYAHNQFTYGVGQFIQDNNQFISGGLSDIVDALQSVATWFINSRITNVRKIISDKLVVNTTAINMDDIENRRPIIRLKGSATGDIDRHIKQLQLQDVTTTHIGDVKFLNDMIKEVTGINDTILGAVKPGKRSATENRNTTSGAATRLKTGAAIIFRSGLEPIGRQMLSNLRDGLDNMAYVKALGAKAVATPEFIQVTKEDLQGNYDFEIFDGTLPTERQYSADVILEILTMLLGNPLLAQRVGFSIPKLFMELLLLRGIKNPERFLLPPQPVLMQQPNENPDANGQPGQSTPSGQGPASNVGPQAVQPQGANVASLAGLTGGATAGFQGAMGQPVLPSAVGGFGA